MILLGKLLKIQLFIVLKCAVYITLHHNPLPVKLVQLYTFKIMVVL